MAHNSPNNRFIDAGSAVFFNANERSAKVANTSASSRTMRGGIFTVVPVESRANVIWNHSHQFFLKLGSTTCPILDSQASKLDKVFFRVEF